VAEVKLDFEVLRVLGEVARTYGAAGAVQHGASTLPDTLFHIFPTVETAEIHLATGFQNAVYEHPAFPASLHAEIEAWCFANAADERKEGMTDSQFVYTTRKKAIGPFKRQIWSLPTKPQILASQAAKLAFLFDQLKASGTADVLARYITNGPDWHRPRAGGAEALAGACPTMGGRQRCSGAPGAPGSVGGRSRPQPLALPALELADEADRVALRWYRRAVPTTLKPDRTFVTEADQAIERLIRERIRAVHPDHGFVGEEYGDEQGSAGVRWYIDPIDGTHNYIRGVPLFGTLLAVEVDGELQVGVMSAPAMGERWYAARGGGAWNVGRDGRRRRVVVSEVSALEDAQLIYGSRRENLASGLMPGFDAVIDACWRERGFGDFWGYALVAEGAAEAMFETGMHSWTSPRRSSSSRRPAAG